jgi:hypothetical protein
MRAIRKLAFLAAAIALIAIGLSACGSGDSDDSTGGSPTVMTTQGKGEGGSSSEGDGSAGFRTPGGDNSIQNFGEEADAVELGAASVVLAAYLRARGKDDWARECVYLARSAVAPLEELASRSAEIKGKGCAAVLATLMGSTPVSTRADTLTGGIASLRVQGDRAFALYHGPGGVDYFLPLTKEDGEWKIGSLAPSEFP